MSWICDSCMHREEKGPCAECDPEDPVRSCYQAERAWGTDKYQDVNVKCPFYKRAIKNSRVRIVVCEGPLKKTSVTLKFHNGRDMEQHLKSCCEQAYELCPLFKMAEKKYEDTGRK